MARWCIDARRLMAVHRDLNVDVHAKFFENGGHAGVRACRCWCARPGDARRSWHSDGSHGLGNDVDPGCDLTAITTVDGRPMEPDDARIRFWRVRQAERRA